MAEIDEKEKRKRQRRLYITMRLEELKAERERLIEERKSLAPAQPNPAKKK